MTIINNTHRFIFVHAPKTAGTSVKRYLNCYTKAGDICVADREDAARARTDLGFAVHKHSTASQIRRNLGADNYSKYFKFGVARNPFGRAVSIYHFLKYNFRDWPKSEVMDSFAGFEDFVLSDFFKGRGPGGIFRSQAGWLCDRGGHLLVDKVCHFEELESELTAVLRMLGLEQPLSPIARRNESRGDIYRTLSGLQSHAVLDRIRQRHERDFQLLGFSPDFDESSLMASLSQSPAQRSAGHA